VNSNILSIFEFTKLETMLNQNRIPSLSSVISLLVILIIILAILFSSVLISIAIISAAIVPITWIFAKISGQSYDRVCDNSQIVYKLNQVGKWTLVIGSSITIIYFLFKMFL